jgi:type IV pilus assembly protein PilA
MMMTWISARKDADERGFTLIELLVVILIIGILSAIAIPNFLKQRQKAYGAEAKSDLRNLAAFEEIYLDDNSTYGSASQIQVAEPKVNPSQGITLSVVVYDGVIGYCLSAQHTGDPQVYYWDSQAGGLQPTTATGCPVTTTGTPGDSLVG